MAHISNTTDDHILFIYPGTYNEQVLVPRLGGLLVIQGYTCSTKSNASNQVTITCAMAVNEVPPENENKRNMSSSTLTFNSRSGVKVYNLNVENSASSTEDRGRAGAVCDNTFDYAVYSCQIKSARILSVVSRDVGQFQTTGRNWITAIANTKKKPI